MITTIIFDLGGVLFTNGTDKFATDLAQKYTLAKDQIDAALDGENGTAYREGKITHDEFWEGFTKELGLNENIDQLAANWINGYQLIHGTKDIITALTRRYKVYYLSDNTRERVQAIHDRFGFLEWFEDGIFSHEIGVRKPHPDVYKITVEKLKIDPKEAVFIDDKPKNLVPAKEIGMATILFESPEGLKRDLVALGIEL